MNSLHRLRFVFSRRAKRVIFPGEKGLGISLFAQTFFLASNNYFLGEFFFSKSALPFDWGYSRFPAVFRDRVSYFTSLLGDSEIELVASSNPR